MAQVLFVTAMHVAAVAGLEALRLPTQGHSGASGLCIAEWGPWCQPHSDGAPISKSC